MEIDGKAPALRRAIAAVRAERRDRLGVEPLDLRAAALFRIYLGVVLALDVLIFKLPNVAGFYGPNGIFEAYYASLDARGFPFYLNLYHALQHDWLVTLYFVASLVAFVLFALGIGGTPMTFACYLAVWMPYMSNMLTLMGEDRLLLYAMFLGLFLPLHERYTLGRRRRAPSGNAVDSLTSYGALAMIGVVYAVAGYAKLGGTWGTGDALRNMLSSVVVRSLITDWSLGQTWLLRSVEIVGLAFELSVVPLLFFPFFSRYLRVVTIVGLAAIHIGSLPMLFPGYYVFSTGAWLFLLIPGFVFDRIERRRPTSRPVDEAHAGSPSWPNRVLTRARQVALALVLLALVAHHANHPSVRALDVPASGPYAAFMARKRAVAESVLTNRRGPTPLKLFYPVFSNHVYYTREPGQFGIHKFNVVCLGELEDGTTVNLMSGTDTGDALSYSFFHRRPYNYLVAATRTEPETITGFDIGRRFLENALAEWQSRFPRQRVRRASLLRIVFDPGRHELVPLRTRVLARIEVDPDAVPP